MQQADTLEDIVCNLCGGDDVRVMQVAADRTGSGSADLASTFSSSSDEPLSHRLVACVSCGLQYVSPRPRTDAVLAGYAAGSDEKFVSQARGRELTSDRCLDVIERVQRGPGRRLLDIGTGGGAFPHMASKRGWEVEACEPNRWLCEWARQNYQLAVRPGTVFDQRYASGSYDLVTLWDVLEHTSDPKAEIAETYRLLSPNGLLVVNYPDIGSWIARLMGRSWVFLLDVHLYYFTRTTIRKLLEDTGFEIVHIRPHYQRLGLGYILHRAQPSIGGAARIAGRLASALKLADVQVPYWIGQTLVIARKGGAS